MKISNVLLTIGGTPFQCAAKSLDLEPDNDNKVLCVAGAEDKLTAELLLTYGATGTYNVLSAMAGTEQVHVVQPLNGPASDSNPKWTFTAAVPRIPRMIGKPDETGSFTYEVTSQGGVTQVFA